MKYFIPAILFLPSIITASNNFHLPFQPLTSNKRDYETCLTTYGGGSILCGDPLTSHYCYDPSKGESCCPLDSGFCLLNDYCAPVSGFCCHNGETTDTCATRLNFVVPSSFTSISTTKPLNTATTSSSTKRISTVPTSSTTKRINTATTSRIATSTTSNDAAGGTVPTGTASGKVRNGASASVGSPPGSGNMTRVGNGTATKGSGIMVGPAEYKGVGRRVEGVGMGWVVGGLVLVFGIGWGL